MKTLLHLPFQRIDGVPDEPLAPTHLVVERIDGQQETQITSAVMTRCVMRTQQQTLLAFGVVVVSAFSSRRLTEATCRTSYAHRWSLMCI